VKPRFEEKAFANEEQAGTEPRDESRRRILAHAYVPWQRYEGAFNPKEALMKGTLFPELYGVYPIPK
jgi:hypothetical protein